MGSFSWTSTIMSRDQFKPIRLGDNLVALVSYKSTETSSFLIDKYNVSAIFIGRR